MKHVIPLLLLLLILFQQAGYAQTKKKTDLETEGLIGKVKQVEHRAYEAVKKNGEIVPGKKIEAQQDNFIRKYNEAGNEIETDLIFYGQTKHSRFSSCTYDNKGNRIEDASYHGDGSLFYKGVSIYDKKNNRIEYANYKADGKLDSKQTWKYDDKGNQIEYTMAMPDASLISKETYTYDDRGNRTEQNIYYGNGSLNYANSWEYTYDEKGNTIGIKHFLNGRLERTQAYIYNEKGYKTEYNLYTAENVLDDRYTYAYDEKGSEIESKHYSPDGILTSTYTSQFEYDAKGNWIKEILFFDDVPLNIFLRDIEYFE